MKKKPGALRRLVPCIKGYEAPTLLTPLFMILEVVMEVLIPLLMAAIVDGGLYREEDFLLKEFFSPALIANNTKFIVTLGCLMVIASLLSLAFGMLGARACAVASAGFSKNLRGSVFNKIQSFSFANTDRFSTPSLVMRCTTDVNNLQNTFSQCLRMLFRGPFMVVLAAIMAIRIDAELSTVFLLALPVLILALFLMIRTGHARFTAMFKQYDQMNAAVQENLIAVREVKSFVRQDYEKEKFNRAATALRKAQIFAEKMFSFANPIQLGIMWSCTVIILALGGKKVMFAGTMGAGELVSLISYTSQVIGSLAMISFISISIAMSRVSLQRINQVFDEEPDIQGPENDLKVKDGSLAFDRVSFSYTKKEDNLTLKDIDFSVKPGEVVGIVGGTGDGKSTLVQLIPRFYDALSGNVLVGGRNVKEYSLFELRESVAMVLQKNMLFSGTIRENLLWGNQNATEEEIKEACRVSCCLDFIESFPKGFETDLGQGGVNVSGGQKQRLCIARALLKKPKILILDDSTSAVDTATDEKIRAALKESLPGATKIIIAQRVASVRYADRILVLDKGAVSAAGSHEELLISSPIYREIYASQMKGGE